jgi:hypothetical protein
MARRARLLVRCGMVPTSANRENPLKAAMAVICGLGVDGYLVAMQAMATALRKNSPLAE